MWPRMQSMVLNMRNALSASIPKETYILYIITYTYVWVNAYTLTHTHMRAHITCARTCMNAHIYACTLTWMHTYLHLLRVNAHTYHVAYIAFASAEVSPKAIL